MQGLRPCCCAEPSGRVPVLALFDREVGSTSDHAQSELLLTVLERVVLVWLAATARDFLRRL